MSSENLSGIKTIKNGKDKRILVTHVNVRQSIVFLIVKLTILDIFATTTALIFFSPLIIPISMEVKTEIISYNIFYFIFLLISKALLSLFVVLRWLNEYYEITPTKVFHRSGIIWRKEDIYDISMDNFTRIPSIGIEQGFLGRIFNYGTLFIYDRGTYEYHYLYFIHNPLRYLEILHQLLPNASITKKVVREHIRDKDPEA
jgi:membrane protein YdbS with pleckstrin-like domain